MLFLSVEYQRTKADMEKDHLHIKAELNQKIEGQTSRISMLEQQLSDSKAHHKEEKQEMDLKHSTELKSQRSELELRIQKLEQDLTNAASKVSIPACLKPCHEYWKIRGRAVMLSFAHAGEM
jgi:hypothetical protein